jgi:hypothetical protein
MRLVARNFQCHEPKMGFGCDCVAAMICIVAQQISRSEGITWLLLGGSRVPGF